MYLQEAHDLEVTLALLCVGDINTNPDGSPICCDVAVDVASGNPYPISVEQWSPSLMERQGKSFVSSGGLFDEVWDTARGTMEIGVGTWNLRKRLSFSSTRIKDYITSFCLQQEFR